MHKRAIVIGAGIVGLSTARALAIRGWKVKVIERNQKTVGASIRNFGMIWPVGQPDGIMYERAMLSRDIWKKLCTDSGTWFDELGSLHMGYHTDEWTVLQELAANFEHRGWQLLSPAETLRRSPFAKVEGLLGSLYSPDEMIVDPRLAIQSVTALLEEKYNVEFVFGRAVTAIDHPAVYIMDEKQEADQIVICSGADFETLYPYIFSEQPITKCKLQMMRLSAPAMGKRIGPPVCGGLSLIHYSSFRAAPSLSVLQKRYAELYPEYLKRGVHVMVSQNQAGDLTVGDSHEYGMAPDPFDKQEINRLILDYLENFAMFPETTVMETWHGVYPKLTNGGTELVLHPSEGVTIINGLGGAGMTLSPGLCDKVCSSF